MNAISFDTSSENPLLTKIHNNPKLKKARMPVILHEELADQWLAKLDGTKDQKFIEELIQAYPQEELEAHTVSKLRVKEYIGECSGD